MVIGMYMKTHTAIWHHAVQWACTQLHYAWYMPICVHTVCALLCCVLVCFTGQSHNWQCDWLYINGLVQDCSNSIALAMESLQPCAKVSICIYVCICVRMYVCMYVSKYICIYSDRLCMHMFIFADSIFTILRYIYISDNINSNMGAFIFFKNPQGIIHRHTPTKQYRTSFYRVLYITILINHKSNDAHVPYPTMYHSGLKCAAFCFEWCGIWKRCIVGFVRLGYCKQ